MASFVRIGISDDRTNFIFAHLESVAEFDMRGIVVFPTCFLVRKDDA